jgi:ribosomal protein L11 methyltransferase
MYSVLLIVSAGDKDRIVAEMWELGTLGIAERDLPDGRVELRGFFTERTDGPFLEGGDWREEIEADWNTQWRDSWQPITVGDRFYLAPEWSDDPAPNSRLRLTMHAGMAFGTGADATTQLCLEAMERHVMQGCAVLDLGTGTGILAIAAKLLGARRVVACDIDSAAAMKAAEHARLAGVEVEFYAGSARSLGSASFDVVAANLNAATLTSLAREIRRLGCKAILSGFGAKALPAIEAVFGLPIETRERGEWVCVVVWGAVDIESPHEATDLLR